MTDEGPTREQKIKYLVRVAYPPKRHKTLSGLIVFDWTPPNAKIFLAELNEQPDNVVNMLYADALREEALQAELKALKKKERFS